MVRSIAVAGPPGAGKTQWIASQLPQQGESCAYYSPRTEALPLDATCLQAQFPQLRVLPTLSAATPAATERLYVELPWHLDLASASAQLQSLSCQRLAVLPAGEAIAFAPWQTWADETIVGCPMTLPGWADLDRQDWQFQRGLLGAEPLEFASLATFWRELTQGAYGRILHVKGLFNLHDGTACYANWTAGAAASSWQDLPPAAPEQPYPAGLEVIGCSLDREAIAHTLRDCCLLEAAIADT